MRSISFSSFVISFSFKFSFADRSVLERSVANRAPITKRLFCTESKRSLEVGSIFCEQISPIQLFNSSTVPYDSRRRSYFSTLVPPINPEVPSSPVLVYTLMGTSTLIDRIRIHIIHLNDSVFQFDDP